MSRVSIPFAAVLLAAPATALAWEPGDLSCDTAPVIGRVVKVEDGHVVINVGSLHGVEAGMQVGVMPCAALPYHEKLGHGVVCEDDPDVTAIVVIDEVRESWSSGDLDRGASAMKGNIVFLSDGPMPHHKGYHGFPEQYLNIWDLSMRLRFLPGVEDGGLGIQGDLVLSYQMPVPVQLHAIVAPALIGAQGGSSGMGVLGFVASWSTRFLEIGLGVGWRGSSLDGQDGLAFIQTVRLGAETGLMIRVWSTLLVDGAGAGRGLRFENLFGEISIPVHAKVSLMLEVGGGGAQSGSEWFRITTGAKVMVRGTGGPGTITVPLAIGAGLVDAGTWDGGGGELQLFGPIITTGIDLRF